MKNSTFYIVDVFAEEKYTGNQLAVFLDLENSCHEKMQKIAQEMNFSETVFITSNNTANDNSYNIRIFTPKEELPFAGHPILGSAYIIQNSIIKKNVDSIKINLSHIQVPIEFSYINQEVNFLWMQQNHPIFKNVFTRETIAPVLNLEIEEIDDRFPIQEVSTGLPFIIIPLKKLQSLKKVNINRSRYLSFMESTQTKGILLFCPETHKPDNDICVRVFIDFIFGQSLGSLDGLYTTYNHQDQSKIEKNDLGVPEDAATGSGNGCLAGYLVKYSYFGEEILNLRIEQGYEINRPSLVLLKAIKKHEDIEIFVGGKVQMVSKGQLY